MTEIVPMSGPVKLKRKNATSEATCEVPEKYVAALIAAGWVRVDEEPRAQRPAKRSEAGSVGTVGKPQP